MFTFKPDVVVGVAKIASKDQARWALCGVHVQAGKRGTKFTASDGKALLRVTGAHPVPVSDMPVAVAAALNGRNGKSEAVIAKDGVKAIRGIKLSGRRIPALGCAAMAIGESEDRVTVTVSGCVGGDPGAVSTSTILTQEGTFPDVDGVIPKRRGKAKTVKFDAVVLRDALDALVDALGVDKDGKVLVRLRLGSGGTATVITGSNKSERRAALCLVMPHT